MTEYILSNALARSKKEESITHDSYLVEREKNPSIILFKDFSSASYNELIHSRPMIHRKYSLQQIDEITTNHQRKVSTVLLEYEEVFHFAKQLQMETISLLDQIYQPVIYEYLKRMTAYNLDDWPFDKLQNYIDDINLALRSHEILNAYSLKLVCKNSEF